jgi:hypothetical protein
MIPFELLQQHAVFRQQGFSGSAAIRWMARFMWATVVPLVHVAHLSAFICPRSFGCAKFRTSITSVYSSSILLLGDLRRGAPKHHDWPNSKRV